MTTGILQFKSNHYKFIINHLTYAKNDMNEVRFLRYDFQKLLEDVTLLERTFFNYCFYKKSV